MNNQKSKKSVTASYIPVAVSAVLTVLLFVLRLNKAAVIDVGFTCIVSVLVFYKSFVDFVNQSNRLSSKIYYSIQTNGTLVTLEWAQFFKENSFPACVLSATRARVSFI